MSNHVATRTEHVATRVSAGRPTTVTSLFVTLILVSLVCWWHWVAMLLRLTYNNEQYSHVLLVFPVSAALAMLEGRKKDIKPEWSPFPALAMVLASLIILVLSQIALAETSEAAFEAGIASLVVCWIGLVMLFFGVDAVRQLLFPLLFLFLFVPIPQVLVEKCMVALQSASSEASFLLFRSASVPVLKNGFILGLPGLDIEVAKQCSGIRSSLILVLSSMVLGHLYLRSWWGKLLFVIAAVPLAIAKNAVRIFTLSMLGMHVNPTFLYGSIHRNGGILFFALALAGLVCLIKPLKKIESWLVPATGSSS